MINFKSSAVLILLTAFAILALGYSLVFPLGEAPDEVSHWSYIRFVATHWELPPPEGSALGETHQPPIYYWLGALATFWIPQSDYVPLANPDFAFGQSQTPNLLLHPQSESFPYSGTALAWHFFRLFSIVMGAVTVWATWRIGNLLLPDDRAVAFAAAAFVAFLPEFTFLSAVVNNDNLVIMLSSLGMLQSLQMRQRPYTWRASIWLGIILGFAVLTKLSGLVVGLFAAILFLVRAYQTREWKNTLLNAMLCGTVALIILAPWMIYNLSRYGDPLGWGLVVAITPLRQAPLTLFDWTHVMGWGLFTSFWGRFGGAIHLRMSDTIYLALALVSALSLLGWLKLWQTASTPRIHSARAVLSAFGLFWALMLVSFVRWTVTVLGTDQARQLFPGLPLFALVFMIGLTSLSPIRRKSILVAWGGTLIALNIVALIYFNGQYRPPAMNAETQTRWGNLAQPADFGNTIRVTDYMITPQTLKPGDQITVTVNWQALNHPNENYWLLLQLSNQGDVVLNKDGAPAAGRPTTDRWTIGQVYTSYHVMTLPADLPTRTYTLRLGLHPFGRWEWLSVRGQDMLTLGKITVEP